MLTVPSGLAPEFLDVSIELSLGALDMVSGGELSTESVSSVETMEGIMADDPKNLAMGNERELFDQVEMMPPSMLIYTRSVA